MKVVDSGNIYSIARRTLNLVDRRLMNHGERVAYVLYQMLRDYDLPPGDLSKICVLGLLHDIGAYKTEEIDHMMQFETEAPWNHSIYGYLYLRYLSPLKPYAEAVLYHHLRYDAFDDLAEEPNKSRALLIHLADRVDILQLHMNGDTDLSKLTDARGTLFDPEQLDCFLEKNKKYHIIHKLRTGYYHQEMKELAQRVKLTKEEIKGYLWMLAYAIDFRSEHMVFHTINTVGISCEIAKAMGLSSESRNKIYFGALLHDLGKMGTPVGILEKPGALTEEERAVMEQHVVLTGHVLGQELDSEVYRIAVRHHEKLDGSGYPQRLKEEDLTLEEMIVAVGDIMSALLGKRSYKESFSKESILHILKNMAQFNKINRRVVKTVTERFDTIVGDNAAQCEQLEAKYQGMKKEYEFLLNHLQNHKPVHEKI